MQIKDLSLLTWLTQLGLSVAMPPAALILLAVWLRNSFDWGVWIIWVAVVLGIYCAVTGFISSMKTLSRVAGGTKKDAPVSYNDHD